MKRLALVILATATVLGAGVFTGCGSNDDESADPAIEEVQRRNWGAYGCMPRDRQRRFDRISDRYEARYGQVVRQLPPGAGRGAEFEALSRDRTAVRLLRALRRIILPYYPGRPKYERRCYERAVEHFERTAGG